MINSLTIMSTYSTVELALLSDQIIIKKISTHHKSASKELMPLISELLAAHNMHLQDLNYIAINQGPGPFTTLRTVIASANGLAFAAQLPLIGIDALHALLDEYKHDTYPTVAMLNAFSNDVYYGIYNDKKIIKTGYEEIHTFLTMLSQLYPQDKIRFIGGATLLYKNKICEIFASKALIPDEVPMHCSIEKIATLASQRWETKTDIKKELFPLYLKTHSVYLQS